MNENMNFVGEVTVEVIRANGDREVVCKDKPNLLTTAGRDWIHGQVYATGTTDEAKYVGVSVNTDVPAAGDVTLTGEIVADGLERAAGVVTHTAGTNVTVVAATFTATGTHTAVQKAGLFTAVAAGTMVHENTFTATTLSADDILVVRWTITAG